MYLIIYSSLSCCFLGIYVPFLLREGFYEFYVTIRSYLFIWPLVNICMTNQHNNFSFTSLNQWKCACWYLNIYIQTIFIAISINLKFAIKNCQHANRAADSIPLISPLNIEWKPLWKYQYISDTYLFQYIHRFDVPLMDYLVQKWLNQHCPYYLLRN